MDADIEDEALHNDDILCEVISTWHEDNNFYLLLKRRIFSSVFTINFIHFSNDELQNFFFQIKRDFLEKNKFKDFCKI